jgi:TonB-dependent starch-binding outer membrane protein SusC
MLKKHLLFLQQKKKLIILVSLLFFSLFSFAQQKVTVSGTVNSQDNTPLEGVSVNVKGTSIGTVTNTQGKFTIHVNKGSTLVLSFVGYANKEIKVNNTENFGNIQMISTTSALGNVVVIGYGSQSKRNLASATSEVTAKDFQHAVINTLDQALQGRVSGVQVINASGEPGAQAVVRIRGNNSLSGDNQPLYVIDGFPVPPYTEGGNNYSGSAHLKNAYAQNGLFGINPDDIESMVVLKDAAATAIYGSRGANGVVLITTKSGKKETGKIGLTNNYTIGSIANHIKMMNGNQYAEIVNETSALTGNPPPFGNNIDTITTNTNWLDATTRQSLREDASLNVSGGGAKSTYYISGNFVKELGTVLYSANKKASIRANLNSKVNNWYSVKGQFSYVHQNTNRAISSQLRLGATGGFMDLIRQSPTIPVGFLGYNTQGIPGAVTGWFANPVIELNSKIDLVKDDYTTINIENDFNILNSLKLIVSLGGNQSLSGRQIFMDNNSALGNGKNGVGYYDASNTYSYNVNAYLTYDKLFRDAHNVNLTLGTEYNTQSLEDLSTSSSGFSIPSFGVNNIGSALVQSISSDRVDRKLQSAFFRGNYAFKGKYILNTSIRVDGASPFAENKKYGTFPTVGTAWNIDKEEFMRNISFISTAKIRASYGETGSQAIDPYSSLQQFVNGLYPTGAGNTPTLTLYPTTLGNANLSWEKTKQLDIGTDLSVLDNRLSFSFDFYNKLTSDLLQPRALPSQSGYTTITDNYGVIQNRGIEFSIIADIINKKNTQLSTQFNISRNKNILVNLGNNTAPTYINIGNNIIGGTSGILTPGQPIGQFYGYKLIGLVQTSDFDANGKPTYPFLGPSSNQHPGAIKYQDTNKDGVINIADRQVLGNAQPDFNFGWTSNFTWKNLSVNLFVTGSVGNDVLDITQFLLRDGIVNFTGVTLNQTQDWYNHRWTAQKPTNDPRYPGVQLGMPQANPDDINSSMVENGSYVRLKSLTFLYAFPKLKVVKDFKLFITATNLLTITKYAGFDPEVSTFNQDLLHQGIDYGGYPTQRSYSFGVSCNF